MMRENESQGENVKMDVVDLIIRCLREHESKFNELLGRLEDNVDERVNVEKLKNYGTIFVEDKRSPHPTNYGQVIKTCYGVNGLEMSTDKGYTICFSDSESVCKKAPRTRRRESL